MAFKRWNKSPSKKPAVRPWKESELKIIGWCMRKKILISTTPDWKDDLNRWIVHININGRIHDDPNRYKDEEALEKMYEYYKYYYDKNKK